jgi:hypothetical protein
VRIDSADLTEIQPAEYRADLVVALTDGAPVLSAIAHGRDADIRKSVRIALAARLASASLDEDRSVLYLDLILASLSEPPAGSCNP